MQQNINLFEQNKIKAEKQLEEKIWEENARLRAKISALEVHIKNLERKLGS